MLKLIMKQNKGKEATFTNFYLELENGYRIQIKNAFKDDFNKLYMIAQKVED